MLPAAPHIRFYAGAPLTTPEGHNIGTVCAIDIRPRHFDERQKRILETLAEMVMHELELRRRVNIDVLTETLSRRAFAEAAQKTVAHAFRHDLNCLASRSTPIISRPSTTPMAMPPVTWCLPAWPGRAVNVCATATFRPSWRRGIATFAHADAAEALKIAEELRQAIEAGFQGGLPMIGITASSASLKRCSRRQIRDAVARADTAMYVAKYAGRNRSSPGAGEGPPPGCAPPGTESRPDCFQRPALHDRLHRAFAIEAWRRHRCLQRRRITGKVQPGDPVGRVRNAVPDRLANRSTPGSRILLTRFDLPIDRILAKLAHLPLARRQDMARGGVRGAEGTGAGRHQEGCLRRRERWQA